MATHSSTLPGKSHRQRSVVGYSPWGLKELDTTERLHFTSLHFTLSRGRIRFHRYRARSHKATPHFKCQLQPKLSPVLLSDRLKNGGSGDSHLGLG